MEQPREWDQQSHLRAGVSVSLEYRPTLQCSIQPADLTVSFSLRQMFCSVLTWISSFQVYIIQVSVGNHQWTVKHRYSDFHDLHEKVSMLKLWPWSLTKLCTVLVVLFYTMVYIISFLKRENICHMPSELPTKSFLWEHYYLPLLHSPLELGKVDLDNFSLGLGWKLCQRGEFRLESLNFLLRRMFVISWLDDQNLSVSSGWMIKMFLK